MHRAVDAIWRWQEQRMLYFLSQLLQYTKETLTALNLDLISALNCSRNKALDKDALSYLYTRWQCFLPCILQHIENKVSKSWNWKKVSKGKKWKGLGVTAPFSLSRELQKAGISSCCYYLTGSFPAPSHKHGLWMRQSVIKPPLALSNRVLEVNLTACLNTVQKSQGVIRRQAGEAMVGGQPL